MGSVASVTCVTAFINQRYSNGSVVTGNRYAMLLGNGVACLHPRSVKY